MVKVLDLRSSGLGFITCSAGQLSKLKALEFTLPLATQQYWVPGAQIQRLDQELQLHFVLVSPGEYKVMNIDIWMSFTFCTLDAIGCCTPDNSNEF